MPEKHELAKLVRQVQKGDLEAFGELYDRHYRQVYSYVRRQVSSPADAEDITAGVFLEALEKIGGFRWRGAGFGAWLFRIARNDVLDHFRKQGRVQGAPLADEAMNIHSGHTVDEIVATAWDDQQLREAIWQLSDDQRQVVLLKLMVNFSNRQIAAVLSKSEGAIKALQHRAMLSLKKIIEGRENL